MWPLFQEVRHCFSDDFLPLHLFEGVLCSDENLMVLGGGAFQGFGLPGFCLQCRRVLHERVRWGMLYVVEPTTIAQHKSEDAGRIAACD